MTTANLELQPPRSWREYEEKIYRAAGIPSAEKERVKLTQKRKRGYNLIGADWRISLKKKKVHVELEVKVSASFGARLKA
jgi:hypothetical protein